MPILLLVGVVLAPVALHVRSLMPDSVLDLHVAPDRFLSSITRGWTPEEDLGRRTGAGIAYLPVALFFSGLRATGLSPLTAQWLWFAAVLLGAAFGMRRLFRVFWDRGTEWQAFASALLYVFNPFVLMSLGSATVLLLTYVALPWLAAEFVLLAKTARLRHVVAIVVITSAVATGINAAQNAIMWFGCIVIVGAILLKGRCRRAVAATLGTVALAGLTSLWWLGPFLASLRGGGVDAVFQTDPIEIGASQSSVREVLRLTGLWALYFEHNGVPYIRSQGFLLSNPVVGATLLAPAGALLALRRLWPDVRAKATLVLILVAVPLAVSVYPPADPTWTGVAYRWLHDHVFVFRAFRSNYKWVALLAFTYALILPTLLAGARSRRPAPRRAGTGNLLRKSTGPAVLAVVLAVGAFPFFADLTYAEGYEVGEIPGYWAEAARWLDKQPGDGRVLFTPGQPFAAYEWGRPSGDIGRLLLSRPVVTSRLTSTSSRGGRDLVQLTDRAVRDPSVPFEKVLALLRVAFVVQRNDLDVHVYDSVPPAEMRRFLMNQPGLRLVRSFGRLDVYAVSPPPQVPLLGTADSIELIGSEGGEVNAIREYKPGTLARFVTAGLVNDAIRDTAASSVWYGRTDEFGAGRVFDGDPSTAWVPARPGASGEWVEAVFARPQAVSNVEVSVRRNSIDAEASSIRVNAGTVVREAGVDPSGIARVDFSRVIAPSVRITITGSTSDGGPNVGISEVRISGVPASVIAFPGPADAPLSSFVVDFGAQPSTERRVSSDRGGPYSLTGTAAVDAHIGESGLASYLALDGVRAVRASSRWRNLAAYSPLRAFDGDPSTAWVPDEGEVPGSWIEIEFDEPRRLREIQVRGRANGIDAEVVAVEVSVDGAAPVRRPVRFGTDGLAALPVNRTASRLRIMLADVANGAGTNVGLSEIAIPGVVPERRSEVVSAGVLVGDQPFPLAPLGTTALDDVVFRGVSVAVAGTASLGPGPTRVASGRALLRLQNLVGTPAGEGAAMMPLTFRRPDSSRIEASVRRSARYLAFSETADPFWTATIDGVPLRPVGVANGYAKVWALDGRTGELRLHFDDRGRAGTWALASLASACGGGLVLMVVLLRRRRVR